MHCIDDKANGIILNHNGDWSGEVRIGWHVAGTTLTTLRQCWCNGSDLVAGRFTPTNGPENTPWYGPEPPVNVLTRAVALAVEGYLRSKMESALDDLFIKRGKL